MTSRRKSADGGETSEFDEYMGSDDLYLELVYVGNSPQSFTVSENDDQSNYLDSMTSEKRKRSIEEILYTEENYISKVLRILYREFYKTCKEHPNIFNDDTIHLVFANIEEIYAVHKEWLQNLKKASAPKREQARIISDVFSDFSKKLECYTQFCGLVPSALERVAELMKDKKAVAILDGCKEKSKQRFYLNDLLPVVPQRLQKYPMLLETLHKQTPEGHPDKIALLSTMETMREVTMYVDGSKRGKDSVRQIQRKMSGYKGKPQVLLGDLHYQAFCGMLSKNRKKIDGVVVLLFELGVLVAKVNISDVKKAGKKIQSAIPPLSQEKINDLLKDCRTDFDRFIELPTIIKLEQLTPSTMPDVDSLQSSMIGASNFTAGWTVRMRTEDPIIFVASRDDQRKFCDAYNEVSDDGIYGDMGKMKQKSSKINGSSWNFPRSAVKLGDSLGSGFYGQVFRGKLSEMVDVAVKTLHPGVEGNEEEFKKEIETLAQITKSNHPNVLQFYGVVPADRDGPIWMLTEFLDRGSLKDFLKNSKSKTPVPFSSLCDYMKQIASGMAHLEALGFVHRDLAARNVLVGTDGTEGSTTTGFICKIADFGLSRVLNPNGEYVSASDLMLPFRWTAPEGLDDSDFNWTSKSDVWAFGVLLGELFMNGDMPYAECNALAPFLENLKKGHRLESPPGIPLPVYRKMLECWSLDLLARPTFADLKKWASLYVPFKANSVGEAALLLGYDLQFCKSAFADRGDDINATSEYLFRVAETEFRIEQDAAIAGRRVLQCVPGLADRNVVDKYKMPNPDAIAATTVDQPEPKPIPRSRPPSRSSSGNDMIGGSISKRPPRPSLPPPNHPVRRGSLTNSFKGPLPPKPHRPPSMNQRPLPSPPSESAENSSGVPEPAPKPSPLARSMSGRLGVPQAAVRQKYTVPALPEEEIAEGYAQVPEARTLSWPKEKWLMNDVDRDMSVALLRGVSAKPGDFLVRPSREPGAYSLSFRSPKLIEHFQIKSNPNGPGFVMSFTQHVFPSLESVVIHYAGTPIFHDTNLLRPVPRT